MRFLFLILSFFGAFYSWASSLDIPSDIRFTLDREEGSCPIVYYFTPPEKTDETYPILILCEGSSSKNDLKSVFFIREYFLDRVSALNLGYLTIEKWGIDGHQIHEIEFWNHYSRSQRLKDHLQVVEHFNRNPPKGWSGEFIFIGVSEGGPLVTDLSINCQNTLATINWVGAGDWNWADELWEFFAHWKRSSFCIRLYDAIPRCIPFSWDVPPSRLEYDLLVQKMIENPTPHQWMGGMTYFYHADAFLKAPMDYRKIQTPFLVVKGTEDSDIVSCDQFVEKARKAGAPITYLRIDGMDHWLRKRPDVIDQSFDWLKMQLKRKDL